MFSPFHYRRAQPLWIYQGRKILKYVVGKSHLTFFGDLFCSCMLDQLKKKSAHFCCLSFWLVADVCIFLWSRLGLIVEVMQYLAMWTSSELGIYHPFRPHLFVLLFVLVLSLLLGILFGCGFFCCFGFVWRNSGVK